MHEPVFRYRITDYDRSVIPSRFVAFLDESVDGPDDWVPRSGRSLGHPGWGFVYHLVMTMLDPDEPNLVVETGTNLATTAILLAQAIRDSGRPGVVRTVELDPAIAAQAAQRVELAGLQDLIQCFQGDSLQMIPQMLAGTVPVRVAFLDGNHFHDHVVREFELVEPHLAKESVVLFDNTYAIAEGREDPRVNGALRTIHHRFGGHLINLPFCSWYTPGIAMWQRHPFEDMAPPEVASFESGLSGG